MAQHNYSRKTCQLQIPGVCEGTQSYIDHGKERAKALVILAGHKPISADMLCRDGIANSMTRAWQILNALYDRGSITRLDEFKYGQGRPKVIYTANPECHSHRFVDRVSLSYFLEPWLHVLGWQPYFNQDGKSEDNIIFHIHEVPHVFCTPLHTRLSWYENYLTRRHIGWAWITEQDKPEAIVSFLHDIFSLGEFVVFIVPEITRQLVKSLCDLVPFEPRHYGIVEQGATMFEVQTLEGRPFDIEGLNPSGYDYVIGHCAHAQCGACQEFTTRDSICMHHNTTCNFDNPLLNTDLTDPLQRFDATYKMALTSMAFIDGESNDVAGYFSRHSSEYLDKYGDDLWKEVAEETEDYNKLLIQ